MRPGAFERLAPPWEAVQLVRSEGTILENGRVELAISIGPFRQRWIADHQTSPQQLQFCDRQTQGPFSFWEHTHRIEADGPSACFLIDAIEYTLPAGAVGHACGHQLLQRKLRRMFEYRHRVTAADIALHADSKAQTMKILVTGSTGLVGTQLVPFLTTGGHDVFRLVRSEPQTPQEIRWQPAEGNIDSAALENFDAVIHLAGENIAGSRWNDKVKARIRESRVEGTRLLTQTLAGLQNPPQTLVCASAIGYYGDRGNEQLHEDSDPGEGFLPAVCRDWEAAADPAHERGIRVLPMRFGIVLSPAGGALEKMLLPTKLGVGGVMGSGKQYWSWIAIDDVLGAIHHALINKSLEGPVNTVAPEAVTNREFTKILGHVLHRPTIFPLPAPVARIMLGEMADSLLLASAHVIPTKLQETGYPFQYPQLEGALRHLLGR